MQKCTIKSDLLLLWERGLTCHVEPYFFLDLIFFFFFLFVFYTESCIVIDKQLVVVKNDGHRARAVQLWKLCMADESLDRPSGRFRFIFRII